MSSKNTGRGVPAPTMKSEASGQIAEGALFIADSHYPHHGNVFLHLLQKLDTGEIAIPQLFLMGDNFDLLFGYNNYIKTFSHEAIQLLQKLSEKLEIHYFEGNHDFCIEALFPSVNVYSRERQPVPFRLGEKSVALSHGDRYSMGLGYELYCKLLRNQTTLTLLKPFEKLLIERQLKKLSKKNICKHFEGFEERVAKILKHYSSVDRVIEGHFHQGKVVGKYISLPSLVCQGEVAIVREGEVVFVTLSQL